MAYTEPASNQPIYRRRHPEWVEHHLLWQWLYDSWEGGERYRKATYGRDIRGLPLYNLVRHKREYPDPRDNAGLAIQSVDIPGFADTSRAWDDDFQYRRARTPVPALVEYAAEAHLSKLYAREVEREGPPDLTEWWLDVDGRGSTIDDWMQDVVAPLLLVLGQLDVLFDHPPKPDGAEIRNAADQDYHGLSGCVASHILPQNLTWWRVDRMGAYLEAVVAEYQEDGKAFFRHWTASESTLYDDLGALLSTTPHEFKRVPIIRLFDRRNPRCKHVGRSRYQAIAQLQQEIYNRDSELILSDSLQAHPLIQGPEDYIQGEGTIPIGPNWLLPMKKNEKNGTATYQGFEPIVFDKSGAESIRKNKADMLDAADRAAMLTKPAGATGTTGSTVAQTGISKRLDQSAGNDFLSKVSVRLHAAEVQIARTAAMVLGGGKEVEDDSITITYPKSFDLATAEELSSAITGIQTVIAASGAAPDTETTLICALIRQSLPGRDDEEYDEIDVEIKAAVAAKAEQHKQQAKATAAQTQLAAATAKATPIDSKKDVADMEADASSPSTNPL